MVFFMGMFVGGPIGVLPRLLPVAMGERGWGLKITAWSAVAGREEDYRQAEGVSDSWRRGEVAAIQVGDRLAGQDSGNNFGGADGRGEACRRRATVKCR